MLHRVAVCCIVLQCVASCCKELQCAVCWSVFESVAMSCIVLQCVTGCHDSLMTYSLNTTRSVHQQQQQDANEACCSVLQCVVFLQCDVTPLRTNSQSVHQQQRQHAQSHYA